jgi:hypothetical protein
MNNHVEIINKNITKTTTMNVISKIKNRFSHPCQQSQGPKIFEIAIKAKNFSSNCQMKSFKFPLIHRHKGYYLQQIYIDTYMELRRENCSLFSFLFVCNLLCRL